MPKLPNDQNTGNRTVNQKREKNILVKTTGQEKKNFTVILSCLADGNKLPPMIIFKQKLCQNLQYFLLEYLFPLMKNGR